MSDRVRGHRLNFPSLVGAYLMCDALPDSIALVDGPDCALYKAHFIHGRHDLGSTLLDIDGRHRICFTNVCAQSVTKDHNELILRKLHLINELDHVKTVFLTSLPGCFITGLDYEHLMRSASYFMKKELVAIPPTSLVGDWIDGYGVTMRALARHMEFGPTKPKRDHVSLVGYLWDRSEGDHRGNVAELRRMLKAIGLTLDSVWLSGEPYKKLEKVRDSGLIVSLPYGREAAADIAEKTGADLLETGLPFGAGGTSRWLRQVAEAAGVEKKAEAFIRAEESEIFDRLEWIVPYLFLHKSAGFFGDPMLFDGFLDICSDLGMTPKDSFLMGREGRRDFELREGAPPVCFEPDIYHEAVNKFLSRPPDLIVSNTNEIIREIRSPSKALVEIGFPSYTHHALADAPFLGYRGFLHFTDRLGDGLFYSRRVMMKQGGRWEESDWGDFYPEDMGRYDVPAEALRDVPAEALEEALKARSPKG